MDQREASNTEMLLALERRSILSAHEEIIENVKSIIRRLQVLQHEFERTRAASAGDDETTNGALASARFHALMHVLVDKSKAKGETYYELLFPSVEDASSAGELTPPAALIEALLHIFQFNSKLLCLCFRSQTFLVGILDISLRVRQFLCSLLIPLGLLNNQERPVRATATTTTATTATAAATAPPSLFASLSLCGMIMDSGLNHPSVLPVVGDVHANSGDIDSLLTSDPADAVGGPSGAVGGSDGKMRRLLEPYERHRAHDLRAECYRRGIRPIKKGPNANDNKNGYILLLRKYDGTATTNGVGLSPSDDRSSTHGGVHSGTEEGDDGESDATQGDPLARKRKSPTPQHAHSAGLTAPTASPSVAAAAAAAAMAAAAAGNSANDLASFYDATQASLVPVLPMQYPGMVKPTATNSTSDLEILSGIANTYTTQSGSVANNSGDAAAFCGNCRTVVTDQLMESIRLGRSKMQLLEYQKLMDQRDRDTLHLKEVVTVLRDLRQSLREAKATNSLTHELAAELEDDIAFFQTLKERTKDRMRKEMLDARERGGKPGGST
ncbi:hypothetical protein ATCC90586_009007 [Pythium insidiosum]|nr:hypothetical protein ATCC90586_009007 [Pythium insidiosum]